MIRKLFYTGIIGLILFEIANVYFIMPMPGGSQEINSIDLAYSLYQWRWPLRILFAGMILFGIRSAFAKSRWLPALGLLAAGGVLYGVNYEMAADTMFYQPEQVLMVAAAENKIPADRLVIGVTHGNEARAYPIQFLGYHHQVRDMIDHQSIMVTYCTVCRTGRVYEPVVNGTTETFRLVGMDHFNAMFEDQTTQSWWRQGSGEAIAGPLKGQALPEYPYQQMTLEKWLELYPNSLIMQPDPKFQTEYDSMITYERGRLTGNLTRRDTASWQRKSWVVTVKIGSQTKVYDWNDLLRQRIIYDQIDQTPVVVLLSDDNFSFVALARTTPDQRFITQHDTLISSPYRYTFNGKALDNGQPDLRPLIAYQEYWHFRNDK